MKASLSILLAASATLFLPNAMAKRRAVQVSRRAEVPPLEIIPVIISGPPENRIDFTFFADGYLQSEREKFLSDATRLANDMSKNQTFKTVRPLMNFWAAFTPSNFSGIGFNDPADTAFGSFRWQTGYRVVVAGFDDVASVNRGKCDMIRWRSQPSCHMIAPHHLLRCGDGAIRSAHDNHYISPIR